METVDAYIRDITYPTATHQFDPAVAHATTSQQSELDAESDAESDENSNIKVEPSSDDEEESPDSSMQSASKRVCKSYHDGPKDPDKNKKERERNLRKGEALKLLREKIVESGMDCECAADEKRMTEETTLKLTVQLIDDLKRLIHQRGGNLANCKYAVPLANPKYQESQLRRSGCNRLPKKQNCYIKFTQVQ